MATDTTNNVAGMMPERRTITVILNEGTGTVTASGSVYDPLGTTSKVITWGTPIAPGNIVALENDTVVTWARTGGIPVVVYPTTTETITFGRIVEVEKGPVNWPTNTAAADSLTERLDGGFYRLARMEVFGNPSIYKAKVRTDGSNTLLIGATSELIHNMTDDYVEDNTTEISLICSDSSGNGTMYSAHAIAASADGDEANALVFITGLINSVTGV